MEIGDEAAAVALVVVVLLLLKKKNFHGTNKEEECEWGRKCEAEEGLPLFGAICLTTSTRCLPGPFLPSKLNA